MRRRFLVSLLCLVWLAALAAANAAAEEKRQDAILPTVFLRHDQSKTLAEINQHVEKTAFWKKFPPEGTEVVSWYVMTGSARS